MFLTAIDSPRDETPGWMTMTESAQPELKPDPDSARVVYQEICESHRAIVTFRAKLLGFLPLASGVTLFVLFESVYGTNKEKLLAPLGVLGFVVTLGLLIHELRGIEDCTMLRGRAAAIEESLEIGVDKSHFRGWSKGKLGVVDEVGAAWIVYLAVLATWAFFAFRGFERRFGWWPSSWNVLMVFLVAYCGLLVAALAAYDTWVKPQEGESENSDGIAHDSKVRHRGLRAFLGWRARAPGR
jgi:hypothetical protein